jgi:hypothetical protein
MVLFELFSWKVVQMAQKSDLAFGHKEREELVVIELSADVLSVSHVGSIYLSDVVIDSSWNAACLFEFKLHQL